MTTRHDGLSLAPMRGLRPTAPAEQLGRLLCPPYDVIGADERRELLASDPNNAVAVILPEAPDGQDPYQHAAHTLDQWVDTGRYATDAVPALYVYEMRSADGAATRGLLGAVELRDPADGVILPHENTMAGPVADRLALMQATQANLEPIYLVYDGGGAASDVVDGADKRKLAATARTPDGLTHTLWAVTDEPSHIEVAEDLANRRALIADGHHRYATYREFQAMARRDRGAGPWDRGLTLLVDATTYGPQVRAIHRVLRDVSIDDASRKLRDLARTTPVPDPDVALSGLPVNSGFAAVLTDGRTSTLVTDFDEGFIRRSLGADQPAALADLDITVLHRVLISAVWGLPDTEDEVEYAHSVDEAIASARRLNGTAVLVRPTPVASVAAVAASGSRMPRKSTLFTPKPASGLVMRRFADQT